MIILGQGGPPVARTSFLSIAGLECRTLNEPAQHICDTFGTTGRMMGPPISMPENYI